MLILFKVTLVGNPEKPRVIKAKEAVYRLIDKTLDRIREDMRKPPGKARANESAATRARRLARDEERKKLWMSYNQVQDRNILPPFTVPPATGMTPILIDSGVWVAAV